MYEKLDGSLGVLFNYQDAWKVVTRGSFTSEQSQEALKMAKLRDLSRLDTSRTYLLEIIYPTNRVRTVMLYIVYEGTRCRCVYGDVDHLQ